MMKKWRFILKFLLATLLIAVVLLLSFLIRVVLPIVNGHTAKVFASSVFVAGRPEAQIIADDVAEYIGYLNWTVNREAQSVTISFHGLASRTAVYHPNIGVTLLPVDKDDVGYDTHYIPTVVPMAKSDAPWPTGDGPLAELAPEARKSLDSAVDWAFQEPDEIHRRGTRAVVVVQNGALVAERYGEGFDKNTPLLGWSMSKSVTSALVGVLVKAGKLDIMTPAPVPEWRDASDPRSAITLDMLLRMSSGLDFNEGYGDPFSDVLHMLYLSEDFGAYTAGRPLAFAPDTHWSYSSGTSNLISRIIRDTVGGTQADYFDFPRNVLFGPLGMDSALIEPDASGTFIGSSYTYATARDWARFGQFYLQDGVWESTRILPEGWVKYCATATPHAPIGLYGAQWWLNAGSPGNPEERQMPEIPADIFFASGHEGQFVVVVPSKNAVIVRLGLTTGGQFPLQEFLRRILDALPKAPAIS